MLPFLSQQTEPMLGMYTVQWPGELWPQTYLPYIPIHTKAAVVKIVQPELVSNRTTGPVFLCCVQAAYPEAHSCCRFDQLQLQKG